MTAPRQIPGYLRAAWADALVALDMFGPDDARYLAVWQQFETYLRQACK